MVCVVSVVPVHVSVEPTGHALAVIATVCVPHTVPPPVSVGAPGVSSLRMLMVLDDTDSPHEVEQVAVYAPDVFTVILGVLAPVDHLKVPLQLAAVIVAV